MAEGTLPPTRRRLERARREGEAIRAESLGAAAALLASLLLVPTLLHVLADEAGRFIHRALTEPFGGFDASQVIDSVLRASLPLVLVASVATFAVHWGASGGGISTGALAPRLHRLVPKDGLAGLWSAERWFAAVRILVGGTAVVAIGILVLRRNAAGLADTVGSFEESLWGAARVAERIAFFGAGAFALVAAADFTVGRAAFFGRMRMTRAEAMRERRDAEGPPEVREARRRAREAMALGASLSIVGECALVVTDGERSAAAIAYDPQLDRAPRVMLLARGDATSALVRAAHARGVPVSSEPAVVRALVEVGAGENSPIPTGLYPELARLLGAS
jgi:flagellar biosynthesis protein FlhB